MNLNYLLWFFTTETTEDLWTRVVPLVIMIKGSNMIPEKVNMIQNLCPETMDGNKTMVAVARGSTWQVTYYVWLGISENKTVSFYTIVGRHKMVHLYHFPGDSCFKIDCKKSLGEVSISQWSRAEGKGSSSVLVLRVNWKRERGFCCQRGETCWKCTKYMKIRKPFSKITELSVSIVDIKDEDPPVKPVYFELGNTCIMTCSFSCPLLLQQKNFVLTLAT